MNDSEPDNEAESFEQALSDSGQKKYVLKLYVAGHSPRSAAAIVSIRQVCNERLKGRYQLEVVDIYQQPEKAREGQIIATPTLIKLLPLPLRRVIGDLTKAERVLVGLDLIPLEK